MRVIATDIPDVLIIEPRVFGDDRGFFYESFNQKVWGRMMWIPEGFAHGFLVLSDIAEFLYKTTDYWAPEHERTIIWNDSDLGIRWPLKVKPVLSGKDAQGIAFKNAEIYG